MLGYGIGILLGGLLTLILIYLFSFPISIVPAVVITLVGLACIIFAGAERRN